MAAPAAPKRSVFPPLLRAYAPASTQLDTPCRQLVTASTTVPASGMRRREKMVRGKASSRTYHSEGNDKTTNASFLQRRQERRSSKEILMEGKKMEVQKQRDQV